MDSLGILTMFLFLVILSSFAKRQMPNEDEDRLNSMEICNTKHKSINRIILSIEVLFLNHFFGAIIVFVAFLCLFALQSRTEKHEDGWEKCPGGK